MVDRGHHAADGHRPPAPCPCQDLLGLAGGTPVLGGLALDLLLLDEDAALGVDGEVPEAAEGGPFTHVQIF